MSVAWVGVGVAAAGALNQANSAGKAAKGQQAAANSANELERYMFDRNVELQDPTISAGNTARDNLLYRLGLSRSGTSGRTVRGTGLEDPANFNARRYVMMNPDVAANEYFSQNPLQHYIQFGAPEGRSGYGDAMPQFDAQKYLAENPDVAANEYYATHPLEHWQQFGQYEQRSNPMTGGNPIPGQPGAATTDTYGDLAEKFQFNTYTPDKFSYTGEDLYKDPSYQFRLEQGQKALDRSGAAAGRFLSGRQLQASSDYNQGAASQEFQSAYNRALGTFGTNEGNRKNAFDTNESNRFNAYQANFSNAINPLLALSGSGQVSSQFLGSAGQSAANSMGNNLLGAANASGAANIATGNAIAGGLNNAYGGYQQNQLMSQLLNRNTGVNNNPSVLASANSSSDPIYSLGSANGNWWSASK